MLQETTWKDGDICSIKLINGDEIVAKISNHDASSITLKRPLVLSMGVDQETQQPQLQMLPTLVVSARQDAKFTISRQHIIAIGLSEDAAKAAYESNIANLTSKR